MAEKWNLVCVDCLADLRLGRLVALSEDGASVRPWFQGTPDRDSGEWAGGSRLVSAIQAFLIQHLGHVTATVEWDVFDALLEELDLEYDDIGWIDDLQGLIEKSPPAIDDPLTTSAAAALRKRLESLKSDSSP